MWEMAAASLHNDVLLDSENVTRKRPIALMFHDDSLVGSLASARGFKMTAQISC